MLAPICLFTYNRLEETKHTVEALKNNYLANKVDLFIFSDGPKSENEISKIEGVREYIKRIDGFRSVTIIESKENKGLANSIIDGVTEIINKFGKIIVLEDDLVTSTNFLDFMNQALDFYQTNNLVHSISGYSPNLKSTKNLEFDNYFARRASSWGWATWKDRWEKTDWEVKDLNKFRYNPLQRYRFNRGGSDLSRMLINQQNGKIDSWAIRWCYAQFKDKQLTVFPKISKVNNIGIGKNSTHTKKGKRFFSSLDESRKIVFKFNSNIILENIIDKELRNFFSLTARIKNRIMW